MGESEGKAKHRHFTAESIAKKRRNAGLGEEKANDWVFPKSATRRVRKFTDNYVSVRLGSGDTRVLPLGFVKQRIGQRNGGVIVQRKGTGFRFNSETGRKAVSKRWKRRKLSRSGYRLGESVVKRPRLDVKAIREKHTQHSTGILGKIFYAADIGRWYQAGQGVLSERTALAILGYHKRTRSQLVPVKILAPVLKRRRS